MFIFKWDYSMTFNKLSYISLKLNLESTEPVMSIDTHNIYSKTYLKKVLFGFSHCKK